MITDPKNFRVLIWDAYECTQSASIGREGMAPKRQVTRSLLPEVNSVYDALPLRTIETDHFFGDSSKIEF